MAPTRCRHFSFTLISATNLPDVRAFGIMKVYAEVSLRTAKSKWRSPVDEVNGTNPKLNTNFKFLLPQSSIEQDPSQILDVELYCRRTFGENKYVGQVNINLKGLFEISPGRTITLPVKVGDFTSTQGTIEFSYTFGELVIANVDRENSFSTEDALELAALVVEFAAECVVTVLGA